MSTNNYLDKLTQIPNEAHFNDHYHEYLRTHRNSKLIMIDFQKFKLINDTYGHNIGDKYLQVFARLLKNNFPSSLVSRLHGDEYSILTDMSQEEIIAAFKKCDEQIKIAVREREIPREFGYNAGSSFANNDLDDSKEKADAMMYHAKKKGERYQPFSFTLWIQKQDQKDFLVEIEEGLTNKNFKYHGRNLFNIDGTMTDIVHISTKDNKGHSMFYDGRYDVLKTDSKLVQFDLHNIRTTLRNLVVMDGRVMISLDYKTITTSKYLFDYFEYIKGSLDIDYDNIILAINSKGLEITNYSQMIKSIEALKKFGFKVCLDKYDSNMGDIIWESSEIDYVRFDHNYWKSAISNPKTGHTIRTKVNMFNTYGNCKSIFGLVETPQEHEFLKSFDEDILVSGNQYSKEKVLTLKR